MSTARDDAAERLATVLAYVYGIGVDSNYGDDPGKRMAKGIAEGLADREPLLHRDADHNAETVLREIGLVAVDPALVAACDDVETAEGAAYEDRVPYHPARLALARHVLDQIKNR